MGGLTSPLALYADLLRDEHDEPPIARSIDGWSRRALVERWRGPADAVDERALAGLAGPVLDVGCGPGRHLHALARRGVFGLGVDLSPVAVGLARGAGAHAIVGSIFDELPRTGDWGSALLLDGNIGIGGCPDRLLHRVRTLLAPGGQVVVELEGPERPSVQTRIRLETADAVSDWFPWAEVSVTDADRFALDAGLEVGEHWEHDHRWFAVLAVPEVRRRARRAQVVEAGVLASVLPPGA